MSTYVIGDVQGCYNTLLRTLDTINYDPANDTLWFAGDLVNRGKYSLQTLRFVKSLEMPNNPLDKHLDNSLTSKPNRLVSVLGNHDIGMMAVAEGAYPYDEKKYTFKDILDASDKHELLSWLIKRPLIHYDAELNVLLVHAGLYPLWSVDEALQYANEVHAVLCDPDKRSRFFPHLFGNTPVKWDPTLTGFDRYRFIVNACLRMRFCNQEGILELKTKESATHSPEGFMPWFKVTAPISAHRDPNLKIIFGHWAALGGETHNPKIIALDTGCVWGRELTALKLPSMEKIFVPCDKNEIFSF